MRRSAAPSVAQSSKRPRFQPPFAPQRTTDGKQVRIDTVPAKQLAIHEGGTEPKLSLSTMEVCFIFVAWEFSGSKSNYLCSRHQMVL